MQEQDYGEDSEEIKEKLEEQHRLLALLEEQVSSKQEEWQQQYEILNKEKSQAIQVARFATQKLIETIQDFQQQAETQRSLQSKVLEVIHRNSSQFCSDNKF